MSNADSKLFVMDTHVEHSHGFFNEHGYFDTANETLCELVGDRLKNYYPGHPWGVKSELEHGIIKICLKGFEQWSYVIHAHRLKGDPAMKAVRDAAGEMLERFGMPRAGFKFDHWHSAVKKYPSHFNRFTKPPTG